jgi:hypothetical protein
MRRYSMGVVALTLAGIGVWAGRTLHAALPVATTAQIDPLPIMASARHLPMLRWTDYSLVFVD